jgi:hypothetical protein
MHEKTFKPRSMGVKELAQLYFPSITPKCASTSFLKWLSEDKVLLEQLSANGYVWGKRTFLPIHVELIVNRFGHP